jgi:hypothetical protein
MKLHVCRAIRDALTLIIRASGDMRNETIAVECGYETDLTTKTVVTPMLMAVE